VIVADPTSPDDSYPPSFYIHDKPLPFDFIDNLASISQKANAHNEGKTVNISNYLEFSQLNSMTRATGVTATISSLLTISHIALGLAST
jgi:hypothetical protein